ncbi:MAG: UDP-N-acetylglucosamine--N-acetylmuramyl-(pentapeptide) pyrophosphoryl-undecaprenol N-acetylglucosamine transferase [Candidatus Colwellbacteria bacterium]|nr:UDP-N-acetylglucosamine--N-acetylmuramyl-(pentapeptide) pyrophosphoryl-undecaprenol N-acetylglucosamine transferase [Candidatus Colwellbacteria bacterium]
MPKFRVLVTGGGTGGHIYPLVAVVSELQILASTMRIDAEIRYLGSFGPYRDLLRDNDIKAQGIVESKLRRYFSLENFIDGPKFIVGFLQALSRLFWFMPDAVFSKGGPGAMAVVLAARFYGIPVIIHESDAIPGTTNLICGRFAKIVTVAFSGAAKYFPGKEVIVVGNPIRRYLFSDVITPKKAKGFLEFNPELPLMLVLGGSQGAVRLNEFILDNLPDLLNVTQIFHQTGKKNYQPVVNEVDFVLSKLPEETIKRYRPIDYFEKDIRTALMAADVVLSRAGAGGIFETAAFGKPSILIPLPEAASGHQAANAYDYAASGAAIVIEESNLTPELLLHELKGLLGNQNRLSEMSQAAIAFSKPDSASNLAKIILKLGGYAS